jgi:hypothetical protein
MSDFRERERESETCFQMCFEQCLMVKSLFELWSFVLWHCCPECGIKTKKQTPWRESASELYRPSDHRLLAKLVSAFADKGCHVVSMTDPHGRILDFLDRECGIKHLQNIGDRLPDYTGSHHRRLQSQQLSPPRKLIEWGSGSET